MIAYHVSPSPIRDSIAELGIDPGYALGKLKVAWYCQPERLLWAIAHVSARKAIDTGMLLVYRVNAPDELFKRTSWKGVYNVRVVLFPEHHQPAIYWINKWAELNPELAD